MMRFLLLLAWAVTVMACRPDVRTLELDSLDLQDTATIQQIRSQLDVKESEAFANYLVRHIAASNGFCGRPLVREDGKPPVTLSDAIELSIAREREERLAYKSSMVAPLQSPEERQLAALLLERDDLISASMFLRAQASQTAQLKRDLDAIDQRLHLVDRRIATLDR